METQLECFRKIRFGDFVDINAACRVTAEGNAFTSVVRLTMRIYMDAAAIEFPGHRVEGNFR